MAEENKTKQNKTKLRRALSMLRNLFAWSRKQKSTNQSRSKDDKNFNIRILEQRHAEIISDLTSQISSQNNTISELVKKNMKLNNEIVMLAKKKYMDVAKESVKISDQMETIEFLELENQNLRDENEELKAKLENINMDLKKLKKSKKSSHYWQDKLNDEREKFEKDRLIYEDENYEMEKKITELMEKVGEYEEKFGKDGRLPPIQEKYTLEQQYMELETEIEKVRKHSKEIIEERNKEIENLEYTIQELKLGLGDGEISKSNLE